MLRAARFLLLALSVAALWPALQAAAAEDGPLSLDDIRDMRRQRMTVKKIADAIEARGLDFTVDDDAAKKLRSFGFSGKLIGELKEKYGEGKGIVQPGGGVEEGGEAKPDEEDQKGAKGVKGVKGAKGAKGAAKAQGKARVLDAQTEADYAAFAERIDKIVKQSGTPVKPHKAKHTTIIANPRIAGMFMPDVNRVETLIKGRFPEPLATGVDTRANNIALLETRYEYEAWIKAMFKVYQDEGFMFGGMDPLGTALKTNAIFIHGIFSVCLEGRQPDDARRAVAFAVGYQYFRQLAGEKSPDALQVGFGNITEAMMFREPGTMVLSGYTDRQVGGAPIRWADVVRQQFAQNQIGSVANALAYSTETMQMPQYAESWSLTSLLATEPSNFAELVTKLGEGAPAADAIKDVYGVTDEQALTQWRKYVLGR